MARHKTYTVQGTICTPSGRPLPDLTVRAFDQDPNTPDNPLGQAVVTDTQGKYIIAYNDEDFRLGGKESGGADIIVRVYEKGLLMAETGPRWNAGKEEIIDITLEPAEARPKAKALEFANIIGLNENLAAKLAEKTLDLNDANEATLHELVEEKILTEQQRDDLRLTIDLSRVSGSNIGFVKALKNDKLESLEEFVLWEQVDWIKALEDNKISLPEGEQSIESYAGNIRRTLEKTFPTQYLLKRVVKANFDVELNLLHPADKLLQHNETLIAGTAVHPEALDWTGINAAEKPGIEQDLENLAAFANTYRHLGIVGVVNDCTLDQGQKRETIARRLSALDTFYRNNPDIDLYRADFFDKDTPLQWGGIEQNERPLVKRQLMAYQRVFNLANDYDTSRTLLNKGFDSALAIATTPEEAFRRTCGLKVEDAQPLYRKAQEDALAAAHYTRAVEQAFSEQFLDNIVLTPPALANALHEIDGFEELFGSQNFCNCEHCRSILSPAAYFADLMHFVHTHVSQRVFLPEHSGNPLYLKNRRPDLWTLRLNCHNTSTEIPYLEIVNDVLEHYLEDQPGMDDVYKTLDIATAVSINLPFHLPLEELRVYLGHFNLSLYDVYRLLQEPSATQRREKIGLSEQEQNIITTPNPGETMTIFGKVSLSAFDVQDFIRQAGISRQELDDLLQIEFLPEIAKVSVKRIKSPDDIQRYEEKLDDLTETRLDLIHRFLRFWKKTPWSIRECDLLLSSLKSARLLTNLEDKDTHKDPKILLVADLIVIQETLALSVEELCVMAADFPGRALHEHQKSLYERLFNIEKIFGAQATVTLSKDADQDGITPLILAGLGITESELKALFVLFGPDTPQDLTIDRSLLSKLFRHTCLAKGLHLSIAEYIHVVTLALSQPALSETGHIRELIEFSAWLKSSPFTASELAMILHGNASSTAPYRYNGHAVAAAVLEIQTSFEAAKTAQIIPRLHTTYHLIGTQLASLKKLSSYTESEIAPILKQEKVSSQIHTAEPDLLPEAIRPNKRDLLMSYLQKTFNLTSDQLEKEFLPYLVSVDIHGNGIQKALNAGFTKNVPNNPDDLDELVRLVKQIERVTLLFRKLDFEAESIRYFIRHKEVFGIDDLKKLTPRNVKNAVVYAALLKLDKERRTQLEEALTQYQAPNNFSPDLIALLSEFWQQPQGQIQSLIKNLTFSSTALEAVKLLWDAQELCQTLGLSGDSFVKLKNTGDYTELQTAREAAFGAFASKYAEEKDRQEKLEPYRDRIHTLKRDALCDYIIAHRETFKFTDRADLYQFFLLDVEMSGCFRTSKLVAAISSVQLYIHRCLMNLEQSDRDLNPTVAEVSVNPTCIPVDEWEWRKNYRVWEANRKVFLYPENYIDPTLRDTKTHLFNELEDELLQEKITKDSAEAAYKKYLAQFAELTKLRYAGAYYHRIEESINVDFSEEEDSIFTGVASLTYESEESLYYLFARTNVQPYQYYYRTYNHHREAWSNWIKIELGIEAEKVSPLIHRGKLYLYWTEVKHKEINKIKDGNSKAGGAVFKVYLKYAYLNESGTWSAPQRLYVGHTYVQEDDVYKSVLGPYTDENEKDRVHDYVFEQFERTMFSKPYARRNNETIAPVALCYLWPRKAEELSQMIFISDHYKKFVEEWPSNNVPVTIEVPQVEFEKFNTSKTVDFIGIVKDNIYQLTATITLVDDHTCVFNMDGMIFTIPVKPQPLPLINASTYYLSLSKNDITNSSALDINQQDTYKEIRDSSVSFLGKEFIVAYMPDEHHDQIVAFACCVEDGSTKFTSNSRILKQYQDGSADLTVPSFMAPASAPGIEQVQLTTILTDELNDILFAKGLEQLLALSTQQLIDDRAQHMDFEGPYGEYYWEMFFHIPLLIANHFNANQKFKDAKWWYERIFNPTAQEKLSDDDSGDRNWQFREFRGVTPEKLQDILRDGSAIRAYKTDPFNPHAIARLRRSSYQKTIVMKYIDNLIDWGDHLFAQDTRESINEAMMLYQLAADILGKRPVDMGKCQTADDKDLTYEQIGPKIDEGSEFLIMLENIRLNVQRRYDEDVKPLKASRYLAGMLANNGIVEKPKSLKEISDAAKITCMSDLMGKILPPVDGGTPVRRDLARSSRRDYQVKRYEDIAEEQAQAHERLGPWSDAEQYRNRFVVQEIKQLPIFGMLTERMAFCVPPNADLLKYWDRVEDRFFKIRHCMNISGIRRSLALFQPPIDPMLLVRARAAGLSLEDIRELLAKQREIPPYRFNYLLEKSRQFTQTVQSFGAALLSALEKKDAEELSLLKSVHERNILRMTKSIKKKQLQEAQYQYQAMQESLTNIQNRIDYYQGLIDDELIAWERMQQVSKHASTLLMVSETVLRLTAGISYLVPQTGSPFAIVFGGKQIGDSQLSVSEFIANLARIADAISASAGLEASFQRREQEWRQQLRLAQQEFKQVEQRCLAAEIGQQIAEKSLELHEKTMEQADELDDFYKNKFTNLGLYNYLASGLNRLYRQAYNMARDMAKVAERAYRFEQDDDTIFIANDNWQADRAGLLAGERLLLQLQKMEQAYLEKNVRRPEITQSFSLALLAPSELITLRQTGSCDIKIPEIAFELMYPGQYKRLIKSVRITIPCIVGPYTNVGARLTLLKGEVENEDGEPLKPLEIGRNTSISTSNANNDSGMFEFNFRDERYLPFEGSGAVSEWRLELPSQFRSFDYNTIADVIMHISYTAKDGDRVAAERELATTITDYAATNGLYRLFSLKHEFPNAFHQLLNPAAGAAQTTEFLVKENHFPYLLIDKTLNIVETKIYLKPGKGLSMAAPPAMKINKTAVAWNSNDDIAMPGSAKENDKMKGSAVALSGTPVRKWTIDAGRDGLQKEELDDILVLMKYTMS